MDYDINSLRSLAMDYSSEGITIADATKEDMPLIDVNRAFELMTGYSKSEVIGRNCRFLQGSETDQPERKVLRSSIDQRRGAKVTIRNYRKDGTMFWNELSISPVLDDDGKIIFYVGVQQDVTERMNMLSGLEKSNTELRDLNAMMVDRELKMVELKKQLAKL